MFFVLLFVLFLCCLFFFYCFSLLSSIVYIFLCPLPSSHVSFVVTKVPVVVTLLPFSIVSVVMAFLLFVQYPLLPPYKVFICCVYLYHENLCIFLTCTEEGFMAETSTIYYCV